MTNEELYEKLDRAINGLTGMALMAGNHKMLAEYSAQAEEALEALREKLEIE